MSRNFGPQFRSGEVLPRLDGYRPGASNFNYQHFGTLRQGVVGPCQEGLPGPPHGHQHLARAAVTAGCHGQRPHAPDCRGVAHNRIILHSRSWRRVSSSLLSWDQTESAMRQSPPRPRLQRLCSANASSPSTDRMANGRGRARRLIAEARPSTARGRGIAASRRPPGSSRRLSGPRPPSSAAVPDGRPATAPARYRGSAAAG
jgi:hypothetical protein